MADFSIARSPLGQVEEPEFQILLAEGEGLYTERKADEPDEGFGPTFASFANGLGGWVLLGVRNTPASGADALAGFQPPGRADLQTWLRDRLLTQVDPVPSFISKTLEIDGKPIGIARVFDSPLKPHVVRDTGAIYVRDTAGKRLVQDHKTVAALTAVGRAGEREARLRLTTRDMLPAIASVIDTPPADLPMLAGHFSLVIRGTPLTVPPHFADLVLTEDAARRAVSIAGQATLRLQESPLKPTPAVITPMRRGHFATSQTRADTDVGEMGFQVQAAADAGGLVAIRLTATGRIEDLFLYEDLHDKWIRPFLGEVAKELEVLEAFGLALLDVWIRGVRGARCRSGGQHGTGLVSEDGAQMGGQVVIPATDEELDALADAWAREFGRGAGLPLW